MKSHTLHPARVLPAVLLAASLALAPGLAGAGQCPDEAPEAARTTLRDIDTSGLRIGVSLGSGSLHGLAHVGVLEALEESGLRVHVVTGTSVGALIGSLWASGVPAHEIARLGASGGWEKLYSFSPSSFGLMTNQPLRAQLEKAFGGRPIESWPMRFGAVATNVDNGQRRILASGSGALAVQASTASPVMYRPVLVAGERLVDGALVEPVPVDAARALGADFVIAVDVAYRPYEEPTTGLSDMAFQAMNILVNTLGAAQTRRADVAIRLDVHERLMRCGQASLVDFGRDVMRRSLPDIARELRAAAARRVAGARSAPAGERR